MARIQRTTRRALLDVIALSMCGMAWGVTDAYAGCSDFNADGRDDVAIGVPGNRVGHVNRAGAVHVLYGRPGSSQGLGPVGDQLWTQRGLLAEGGYTHDIEGVPEEDDAFGQALATGDFNGDGFCDFAIGVPGEDLRVDGTNVTRAGVVIVLYGSSTGLSNVNHQLWTQKGIMTSDGFSHDIAETPIPTTASAPSSWPATSTAIPATAGQSTTWQSAFRSRTSPGWERSPARVAAAASRWGRAQT